MYSKYVMDGVEKKVGDIVVCIILRDRIVFLLVLVASPLHM